MGAAAISTLAGALLVLAAGAAVLAELRPFLKGATVAFWSMAIWRIPLLLLLCAWRHVARRTPLRYDVGYWSAAFPLGMYTVATLRFAEALDWPFLAPPASPAPPPSSPGVAAFAGLLRSLRAREGGRDAHGSARRGTPLA